MAIFTTVLMMDVRTTGKYINGVVVGQGGGGGTFMDVALTFSDTEME
jgi:hypothetical protein